MAKKQGKKERYIFTESIHGASIGIRSEDKDVVHFKFSDYKLPRKGKKFNKTKRSRRGREVANLDMFKDVDDDITILLRVYLLDNEIGQGLNIFIYKNIGWVKLRNVKEVKERHGKWRGYLQVKMKVGDPPIAVG